jgi:hypothetical protein
MSYGVHSLNGRMSARIGHERRAWLRAVVALGPLLAWLSAGCSDPPSPPILADGGASNDAPPTSDMPSTADAPASDEHPGDTTPTADGDTGCECSIRPVSTSLPPAGILSMSCYCPKQDWHDDFGERPNCPTYDDAVQCPDAARSFNIATYKNCNLVTVNYDVSNAVDMRVYDGTTHELVGAMRGTDFVVSTCGSGHVGMIQSGVVPGPECVRDQWVRPCDERDGGDVPTDAGPSSFQASPFRARE